MRVSNDDRRTIKSFSFVHSLNNLHIVSAHRNLRNINVTVRHSNHSQIFLRQSLTCGSEFSGSAHRGSLRLLTTGIRVNTSIHNEDVDVFAGSDSVVKTAEADIISPTVTTQNPNRFLDEVISQNVQLLSFFSINSSQFSAQFFNIIALSINFCISLLRVSQNLISNVAQLSLQTFKQRFCGSGLLVNREAHTQTKLGVIFKQRVSPSRSMTFFIFCIRCGRQVTGVNRRASGSVSNNHTVTKELC